MYLGIWRNLSDKLVCYGKSGYYHISYHWLHSLQAYCDARCIKFNDHVLIGFGTGHSVKIKSKYIYRKKLVQNVKHVLLNIIKQYKL